MLTPLLSDAGTKNLSDYTAISLPEVVGASQDRRSGRNLSRSRVAATSAGSTSASTSVSIAAAVASNSPIGLTMRLSPAWSVPSPAVPPPLAPAASAAGGAPPPPPPPPRVAADDVGLVLDGAGLEQGLPVLPAGTG